MITEQNIFPHSGGAIEIEGNTVNYKVLSELPLVIELENVISESVCNDLIEISKNRLKKSKINSTKEETNIRTSSSMFFEREENQTINEVEDIASYIMGIGKEHGEGIQILNYQVGQEFKSHFDYFKEGTRPAENNRISTLIFYLNDVEEGGETTFPNLNISVRPKKGNAVYFEYFYDEKELNEKTLHTGNPVVKGEKWAATQWMRRKPL